MQGMWQATLDPHSPRYADWHEILGTEEVPLKSPAAFTCRLGEAETDVVYALDLQKFNDDQFARLVDFIRTKFRVPTKSEVIVELTQSGFPIRSTDVIVAYSLRAFV